VSLAALSILFLFNAPAAGERWVNGRSGDLAFYSDGSDGVTAQIAERILGLRAYLESVTGSNLSVAGPVSFVIFEDESDFVQSKPSSVGVLDAGYLIPHEFGSWAATTGDPSLGPIRFVYRQYVLHLLHHEAPNLPLWFRDGLGEVYSNFEIENGEALVGRPPADHVKTLRRSEFEGLQALAPEALSELQLVHYDLKYRAQTWAMVHYLLFAREGAEGEFRRFLDAVAGGVDESQAIREGFGLELVELEAHAKAYVEAGQFRFARVRTEDLSVPPIAIQEMHAADALAVQGELALRAKPENPDIALGYFQKARSADPQNPRALAGLAWAAEMNGDEEASYGLFELATAEAPADGLLHYAYGRALSRSFSARPETDEGRSRLEDAVRTLRRATELEPMLVEAWGLLGFVLGFEAQPTDDEVVALQKALELAPQRIDFAQNLLLAHARRGQRREAEFVFRRIRDTAGDPVEVGRAREILLQLTFQEANHLIRRERFDDAVAGLARVKAETASPELAARAQALLDSLQGITQFLGFVDHYRGIVEAIEARDFEVALARIDGAVSIAKAGRQQEALEEMRADVSERALALR